MKTEIRMPAQVDKALSMLNNCGFESYIVGGCVRDAVLGSVPSDWDITTSASPTEIMECFSGFRTIGTGLKHGTVTAIVDSMHLEVTTYRIDGKYTDNRRPDSVTFTDKVALDLRRRDFTINAMAYNKAGLVDLFGGMRDIENNLVRCVGDPDERFNEDGLRILRAMRFASVLGFSVEEKTRESIHKNKGLLKNISSERIYTEFCRMAAGTGFLEVMSEYRDVIEEFIPQLTNISREVWIRNLKSSSLVDSMPMKLSLLLYGMDGVEILKNLKSDNSTIREVNVLTKNMKISIVPDIVSIRRLLGRLGQESLRSVIQVQKAVAKTSDLKMKTEDLLKAEELMNKIIGEKQCCSLIDLAIKGTDVVESGIPKGPRVGEILERTLEEVIKGNVENDRDVLLNFINSIKD